MTPLDLRIKYKFETGKIPTYGRDYDYAKVNISPLLYNYKGALTYEYAEWIQSLQRGDEWKQNKYQRSTGNKPTYYKNRLVFFTKDYKEWLEDEFCHYQTWLEQHNMTYRWD